MPHRWCSSAALRRYQIESGLDLTFNEVFKPLFTQKISQLNPIRVLEVGAGTGHLSKALTGLGFDITAIEPSNGMYSVATDVLRNCEVTLKNCTSFDLEESSKFDVAISHLVAHAVENALHFFSSISKHLNSDSHFIFSIPHPCFYNNYKSIFANDYNYMQPTAKNISFSITKDPDNQISDVPYHHRPLSIYVKSLVRAGFAIDGFEEVFPTVEIQQKYGALWKEPRYCIFICRRL